MPEHYKTLLSKYLQLTRKNAEGDQRSMFSNAEVQDLLLDLWMALNVDFPMVEAIAEEPVPVPA